jgi:hypothetical protein
MLSAASGRTTMYLATVGRHAWRGRLCQAKRASAAVAKTASERAVSHAHLRASDPSSTNTTSKAARLESLPRRRRPPCQVWPPSRQELGVDARRAAQNVTGAQLKSSKSAPAVAHTAKPKRSRSPPPPSRRPAPPTLRSRRQPSSLARVSSQSVSSVVLRDATTKVEFDGHQRYVCAKCAERFTALQKALSFDDNDDDDRAADAAAARSQESVQSPTTEARRGEPTPEANFASRATCATNIKPRPTMARRRQQLRQVNMLPTMVNMAPPHPAAAPAPDAPPSGLSMPVVERVSIPERRVALTAAYVSDSDDDDDGDNGYLPLAAGARVLGTMSLSDSRTTTTSNARGAGESYKCRNCDWIQLIQSLEWNH